MLCAGFWATGLGFGGGYSEGLIELQFLVSQQICGYSVRNILHVQRPHAETHRVILEAYNGLVLCDGSFGLVLSDLRCAF